MTTSSRWRKLRPTGLAAAVLLILPGCDFGIESVNIDDTRLRTVEPQFQLNQVIVSSAPQTAMFRCEASVVQQHLRVFTGVGACANFNIAARNNMGGNWTNAYQTRLRALNDILDVTESDPTRVNLHSMARIMRAYTMMRVTDTYGDVPYTEAARAYTDGIVFPAYDAQEFIYTSPQGILEELRSATAALNASQPTVSEAMYNGNITQWRRFGNSLLLRAGMRLTKVNPTLAQQYVQAAVAGGVMESNADDAVVRHENNYRNPMGTTMNANEGFNEYAPEPFVNYLKNRGDPRTGSIFVRYPVATSGGGQTLAAGNSNPANQIGIPMGYDNNTIGAVLAQYGINNVHQFSQTDRRRVFDVLAPSFLVTNAQTQLLLAEAAHRGWVSGNPATYYANGMRAHLQQVSTQYQNTAIPPATIDAFVAANPLNTAGNVLEQINTEYWVASFAIPDESWANFRRSCYPALPPSLMQGDLGPNERFMRRLLYPEGELALNPNYDQGTMPDRIDTRIWWDVRVSETC